VKSMFNYYNRQYIFRQSNGELINLFCDSRQNLCFSTLTKRNMWSNPVTLQKNVYQYFYADMDDDNLFHIIYQDNSGNINYSRLDSQSIKTMTVLNAKSSSLYNKQLFIAPFTNTTYFFYVLHHDNSFMLAYQALNNSKITNPKVIDYVSGSSLPCSMLYDSKQNIYAFYQSYDGKYLQLGYKKLGSQLKNWSDFTPVTKYNGNCEYPHAIVDDSGTIHLCYQRRAPKLFEMVYQQKSPDKNLWTPEIIIHSSVHSFDSASILLQKDTIVIYWVREEAIYYNSGSEMGTIWSKPSKLNFPAGRQLQCIIYKSNSPIDRSENHSLLPPGIYPGNAANGFNAAFLDSSGIKASSGSPQLFAGGSQLLEGNQERASFNRNSDVKSLVFEAFKEIQGNVEEIRESWKSAREEIARLNNSYNELSKEFVKHSIQLNVLEKKLDQGKKLSKRLEYINNEVEALKEALKEGIKDKVTILKEFNDDEVSSTEVSSINESTETEVLSVKGEMSAKAIALEKNEPSLEPDKLKEWQEWKEPKEWQGVNE